MLRRRPLKQRVPPPRLNTSQSIRSVKRETEAKSGDDNKIKNGSKKEKRVEKNQKQKQQQQQNEGQPDRKSEKRIEKGRKKRNSRCRKQG